MTASGKVIRGFVCVITLVAGGMFSLASGGECGGESSIRKEQRVKDEEPEGTLNAVRANTDYQMNQADGDKKYKDKIWIVEGLAGHVTTFGNSVQVSVDNLVLCDFSKSWGSRLAKLHPGQRIEVKCRCAGYSITGKIRMENCILLEIKD